MASYFSVLLRVNAALLAMAVIGCASTAKLPRAAEVLPGQWSANVRNAVQASASAPESLASKGWSGVFSDPILDKVIQQALSRSSDLKTAEARVREARALRAVAVSDFLPHVSSEAVAQRSRTSDAVRLAQGPLAARSPAHQELYDAGFDASWELDLFGQVRQRSHVAQARLAAEQDALEGMRISLTAEVARIYFELRGAQLQQKVLQEILGSRQETVDLVTKRQKAGLATGLEVALSQGQLESAAARIPLAEQQIQRSITALAVLAAMPSDEVRNELGEAAPFTALDVPMNIGVPSDLLRCRPDIRQAEHTMEAAAAAVGVAVGDLFPHLTLLGSGGVRAPEASALDALANRYWSIGPALQWPIFDIGRVLGNIRAQRAKHEQVLHQYEKAVLIALKDTEDAVVACREEQGRRRSLDNALNEYAQAFGMAKDLYASGVKDYLYVLEAQRGLLEVEAAKTACDASVATMAVSLYKALGGAWDETLGLGGAAQGV